MASYATDPRTGLLVVTQDDGLKLPGMMPEMAPQLDAMGMTRVVDGPAAPFFQSEGGGGRGEIGPPTEAGFYEDIGAAHDVPPDAGPQRETVRGPGGTVAPAREAVISPGGTVAAAREPVIAPSGTVPAAFEGAMPPSGSGGRAYTDAQSTVASERPEPELTDLGPLPSAATAAAGRGGGAKFADVPLSKLRVTGQQVEHDRYDALSPEERMARQIPLAEQEQRLGFQERQAKLDRDNALLLAEKKYYDDKNLLQKEEQKQAEINKRTRLLEYERNELDKEAKNASVDPKRYFNDMSIWTKMVAAIGATLQGAAMGLSGQGGGMPPIIGLMQELNREDIEGQKLKMESAVARGKLANDRYEKAVALWGDPDLAEMQMERDKLALTDGWLARQQAAQQGDSVAAESFATMRQQITERRIALDDELSLRGKAKVTDRLEATPQRLVGGGGGSGGGVRVAKPKGEAVAAALDKLEKARAAKAYAEQYAKEHGPDAKLPGYGVGGWVANAASTVVQGTGTAAQEAAGGHISALASGLKQPGENSDADFDRIKGRVVGNGQVGNLLDSAKAAEANAIRELEAAQGYIPQ